MTRYIVFPGVVVSRTDGQRHFIGFGQLVDLYCIPHNAHVVDASRQSVVPMPDDIICRPLYSGDYPRFKHA